MRASCLAFCNSRRRRAFSQRKFLGSKGVVSKRPATASGCGGAGSSAASPLLPMRPGIAFVAPPCIRPRGARNAAHTLFSSLLGVFDFGSWILDCAEDPMVARGRPGPAAHRRNPDSRFRGEPSSHLGATTPIPFRE